jgi:hypothetical protein
MLNGDSAMAEALAGFVHRLQESLFSRRQESYDGRVLAAIIELHKEGEELSSKNIADKANEMDEEATVLTSEKVGWLTRRLGFKKDKGGSSRRRVICWDQDRIDRLVKQYGLKSDAPVSQEKPFNPFGPFETASEEAKGFGGDGQDTPKPFGTEEKPFGPAPDGATGFGEEKPFVKPFERESVPEAKGSKGSKGFSQDTEEKLGMTIDEAVATWSAEGRPVIHLGPGENCLDLAKLLSHRDINERHLAAVREWLEKRQR